MSQHTPVRWTSEEDAILREMIANHSHAEIGARLGRTEQSVRNHAWAQRLRKAPELWTDAEILIVRDWYAARVDQPLDLAWLSVRLGRSVVSIELKASRLGLAMQPGKRNCVVRGTDGLSAGERRDAPVYGHEGSEELRAGQSRAAKKRIETYGHPRGALGMKHTNETKAKLAEASRRLNASYTPEQREAMRVKRNATNIERYGTGNPAMLSQDGPYSRAKRGRREDLDNRFFRSRWEANYARYLNFLIAQKQILRWEYEPQTFVFHGVTRGALTYKPDFKVFEMDGSYAWHEIKGWMDATSKAKLKRMGQFYPNEKVIVIDEGAYKEIAKWRGMIPGWEQEKGGRPPTEQEVEEAARSAMAITDYLREQDEKGE